MRLWRKNSLDSSAPTTASNARSFGAGQNNGETRRASASSRRRSCAIASPTSGVRSNRPEAPDRAARIKRLPVGRHHGAGEMPAGGMAVDHHALTRSQPQEQTCVPDLIDDLGDGDLRAEI